jgi:SAM-dependent methyltransferase
MQAPPAHDFMSPVKLYPALIEQAAALYRPLGKFAWRFARGKLKNDPVFAGLLRLGLIPAQSRVLDIGCGQGLLAALLCSLQTGSSALKQWPKDWAPAPLGVCLRGIELMPADVVRAQGALEQHRQQAQFILGDMCSTDFGKADVAVILDVLHYVNFDAQNDILRRVRTALNAEGRLLLRVGNAAAGLPFHWSNWVDTLVALVRRQRWVRLYCRPLSQWLTDLAHLGFHVETVPMHKGTPFANVLLIARPVTVAPASP